MVIKPSFGMHYRCATYRPLLEIAIVEPPNHIQDMAVKEMWDINVGVEMGYICQFYCQERTLAR